MRVVLVPPDVNELGGHAEQLVALFALHRLSAPQSSQPPLGESDVPARQNSHCVAPSSDVVPASHAVQLDAPGSDEYVPAVHGSATLVPSHAEPAGHSVQLVRVVFVPPDVNELGGHTEQLVALFALQRLSVPHSWQAPLFERNVPARQKSHCVAPSVDAIPAGHTEQLLAPFASP